jgi:hypothetical protein
VADSRPFITAKAETQRGAKKRTKMPKKLQVLCKYSGRVKRGGPMPIASLSVSGGKIVGIRFAIIDFPDPAGRYKA